MKRTNNNNYTCQINVNKICKKKKTWNKRKIFFYRYEHLLFSAIITTNNYTTKINSIIYTKHFWYSDKLWRAGLYASAYWILFISKFEMACLCRKGFEIILYFYWRYPKIFWIFLKKMLYKVVENWKLYTNKVWILLLYMSSEGHKLKWIGNVPRVNLSGNHTNHKNKPLSKP